MATSPAENCTSVTTSTISINGEVLDSTISIIDINVYYKVNHIATAEIIISDGDMVEKSFTISDSETFKPGSSITINAGYGNDDTPIFEGVIISHGINITNRNSTSLNIICKDQAAAMTIAKHSQCFLDKSDSDIISSLLSNYSNVTNEIGSLSEKHGELVQFNSTDWDFILTRAEANGFVITNAFNKVTIDKPETSGSAPLIVTYGSDLISFSTQTDARNQFSSVTATAWDSTQQDMIQGSSSAQSIAKQGNFTADDLASVFNISDYTLQTASNLSHDFLTNWASGQQVKAMLSKVRGTVEFPGSALAQINTLIELAGVGERYNGSHYIGAIHHSIRGGQWITTAELGLSPMWSTEHRDIGAPPASGYLPSIDGLQIGIVAKLDADPETNYRIQIKIPTLNSESNLIWARLATYSASANYGNFFIPDVGDEVIVGFINQDPSNPIILGSVYSSKNTMPNELTAENYTKGIVTKSNLKVTFDDENSVITLATPKGNTIIMSDSDESITITDQNSNSIQMGSSGITISSSKDIELTAKGAISLSSTNDTTIKATGDAKMSGLNVSVEAQTGLTLKGNATAELSCSGITTVKGSLVKIN